MKTKRQEQFRTGFRSVQRLHSWVTAKALMLLVMLMVSVQGAWAQSGFNVQQTINHVKYQLNAFDGYAKVLEIDDEEGVEEIVIPTEVERNGVTLKVMYLDMNFSLRDNTHLKRITFMTGKTGEGISSIDIYVFQGNKSLETIVLPNTVTDISGAMFMGCSNLRRVVLPSSITSIGSSMFKDCVSLATIDIREGVTSIGDNAFEGCSSLESVILPSTLTNIGYYAFKGCTKLRSVDIPVGITQLIYGVFQGCTSLTSVTLSEGLTRIQNTVFEGTCLTSLHIPASLVELESQPFRGSSATLTNITVAPGNTKYDSRENCNALIITSENKMILGCKNSSIPNNITVAGFTFRDCIGLTSLTLPKKANFEDYSVYGCTNLNRIICTSTNPGDYTFGGYMYPFPKSQITLVVPHQALASYTSMLSGFKAIESDPSSVRKYYISDLALGTGGTSLDNFTDIGQVAKFSTPPAYLSSSTNYLMSHAITDVRLVKAEDSYWLKDNLVIDGKTYTKGKGNGFGQTGSEYHVYYTTEGSNEYGTPLLASLEIEEKNQPCEDNDYIGLVTIDENGNVIEKTSNADWNDLEDYAYRRYIYVKGIYDAYKIPTNEIHYITKDNRKIDLASSAFGANLSIESNEYSEGQGIIVFNDVVSGELSNAFAGNDKLSYVILPDGINSIGNGAFEGCSALTGVTASKLYHIGDNAFKGCASLEKATLSEWSVTDMGTGAFEGCTSLQSVNIPSGITTISEGTFKGCTQLTTLSVSDKLTSIATSAFENCESLETMNVPEKNVLKSIGNKAFKNTGFGKVNWIGLTKLTEIGEEVFADSRNLWDFAIFQMDRIPSKMFANCPQFSYFLTWAYSGTMDDIADDAFNKATLAKIDFTIAENVTAIPANKFKDYEKLNLVNFSAMPNLASIGDNAFRNTKINKVNLASNSKLTDIGTYAFADNPSMDVLELPLVCSTIKEGTFMNCTSLVTVTLRDPIVTIGDYAFKGCSKLQTLLLNKGLQTIGSEAFAGSKNTLEVIASLAYEGTYASNTNCFDNAVYTGGTLRRVGENNANDNIYNKAPWSSFTNSTKDASFYVEHNGATYRIYDGNYETVDGRMLSGAVLVSTKADNIVSEVGGYPVVGIAPGAVQFSGQAFYMLTIPGSVVSLPSNFMANPENLYNIGFNAGSEPLYIDTSLKLPNLKALTVDRDINCLEHGPFEGLKTSDTDGIYLNIGQNTSYVADWFCKNSDVKTLDFNSAKKFTFGNEAFRGCDIARVIVSTFDGTEENPDSYPSNLFDMSVYRNAVFSIYGSKWNTAKFWNPWVNFVDPEVTQVIVDDAVYKIYPRCSYSYNIKGDCGVHNLTGAVLTGRQAGTGDFTGDVVIPDKVAGFPVIAVAENALGGRGSVSSLSLPGTLRMIENDAVWAMGDDFKKFTIRDQKFPRGEKCYIGYKVFDIFDEEAFYRCDKLKEVSIGVDLAWEGSEDEPFEDRHGLRTIRITPGCQWFGYGSDSGSNTYLFNSCDAVEEIIIEDGTEPIHFYAEAFEGVGHSNIKKLYVGRNINTNNLEDADDDEWPFYEMGDDDGSQLIIGDQVEYIGKRAFEESCFTELQLGRGLKHIDQRAFYNTYDLVSINYTPNLEIIGEEAFNAHGNLEMRPSFWCDPEHPEESKLKRIEDKIGPFNKLYLPPSLVYAGSNNTNVYRAVYLFHNDSEIQNLTVSDQFYVRDGENLGEVDVYASCSFSEKFLSEKLHAKGRVKGIKKHTLFHSKNSKKGGTMESDGLYHEVCAGCGDVDRSAETNNFFISKWNGTDDIMIHKSGSSYTYAGPLAIDDSKPFRSPVSFSAESVSYNRTVTGGRVATFVLPFASNASDVNGTVYKFREFKDSKFCFDEQTGALDANTPYLVVVNEDATQLLSDDVTAQSLAATVSNTLSPLACNVTGSDEMAQHVGSFVQQSLTDGQDGKSYYGYDSKDGAFVKAKTATLKPFRTMFTLPQSAQAKRITLQLGDDNTTTGTIQVDTDLLNGEGSPMYDLNGVRIVTSPVRGKVYIQNGKKMISK